MAGDQRRTVQGLCFGYTVQNGLAVSSVNTQTLIHGNAVLVGQQLVIDQLCVGARAGNDDGVVLPVGHGAPCAAIVQREL